MNVNLRFVSLVLGIILWVYVNMILSPVIRRTVTAKVEYRNMPALMRVTPQNAQAEVVLNGTRRDFIMTGRDPVQISIDLYTLRPGPALLPLKVNSPSGLTVVAVRPAQLEVVGEALVRKEFPVTLEVRGQTGEGFIAEAPMLTPRKVVVEGPKELVERIVACQAVVAIEDVRNSVSEGRKVAAFLPEGEVTEGLRIIPEKVTVDITVKAGYPSKVVPVATPTFLNKPPEGLKLEGFHLDPATVTVAGPPRVLQEMKEIALLPIDLSPLQGSSTVIGLLKPAVESLSIVGSPTVTVSLNLGVTQVVRPFRGLPLTLRNSPNQHCVVSPASYSLLMKGLVEDLSRISATDLAVVLDTREMRPGTYQVPLPCPTGLPERLSILEIQPAKVQVEISETTEVRSPASAAAVTPPTP